MSPPSDSRSSTMFGPWKLFRVVFRIVLFAALTWFLLALLWAFIPSPSTEQNDDNGADYTTSQLRSGKVLTRVYESQSFRIEGNYRQGFALDYKLDVEKLTLSILSSGAEQTLPIINGHGGALDASQQIEVFARIGDVDGANLPWFRFADSVLLYWWIQKEDLNFTVVVDWTGDQDGLRRMDIRVADTPSDPLLKVEIQGNDKSTITVIAPKMPLSSPPSWTYPIRVAIIHIIAPTAVFVNDLFGNAIGAMIDTIINVFFVILVVILYGFFALAVVFSLWRCLGGPSFETTFEATQGRLERLAQNERIRFLRIAALQERLELMYHNKNFKAALNLCRNGWHPEREAERATAEENDVEKATISKE